jgi:hypothetical protein
MVIGTSTIMAPCKEFRSAAGLPGWDARAGEDLRKRTFFRPSWEAERPASRAGSVSLLSRGRRDIFGATGRTP